MKKKWIRPNLIVMVRGRTEERVLLNCKTTGNGSVSNLGTFHQCETTGCAICSVEVAS